MAKRQTASKSLHAVAGAILVSFGLLLLFANLDEVAAQIGNSFSSAAGSFGAVIELGLAGLRAVQAYFFDQATFQAGLHAILVSFWPVILVIIGATLLQNAIAHRFGTAKFGRTISTREYESES
jgi:hypothetical protein